MMRSRCRHILIICAAVLLCGCYNSEQLPKNKTPQIKANVTLAELRNMCYGESIEIEDELVVSGVVTSSDEEGNFYRTFTIEAEEGAAEIKAGVYDLYNHYPLGCRLYVKLKGCAVGVERGVVQVGLMPEMYSNYIVDYFYSRVLLDRHIVRSGEVVDIEPAIVRCEDLTNAMCGRLVCLHSLSLQLDSEGEEAGPATWAGYHAFADEMGNVVYIYTSEYATFATEPVPTEPCDVTGVLQFGDVAGAQDECFILKMRSEDDCLPSGSNTM